MSTLFVDELFSGVEFVQAVRIKKTIKSPVIRPWIYKQGTIVDGTFTCDVKQNGTLLASSTIPFADINTNIPSLFAHGYIRFDFANLALHLAEGEVETEYTLHFYMTSHTTDNNNFIGIVREWDDRKYITYGDVDLVGDPINSVVSPAGIELFEYRSV